MNAILLFGAPCSGKTEIAERFTSMGYLYISVDESMGEFQKNPSKTDFIILSDVLLDDMYNSFLTNLEFNLVFELGCLLKASSVETFRSRIKLTTGKAPTSVLVRCEIETAKARASERNSLVSEGKSKAVLIDEPDKIEEFVEIFGKNRPNTDLEVDTTSTDTIGSVNTIIKYLDELGCVR
jgi:hypothetical protein